MYAHLVAMAHRRATTDADRARCLALLPRARELDLRRSALPAEIRAERGTPAGPAMPGADSPPPVPYDPVNAMDELAPNRAALLACLLNMHRARDVTSHLINMIRLEPDFPVVDGIVATPDLPVMRAYRAHLDATELWLRQQGRDWPAEGC